MSRGTRRSPGRRISPRVRTTTRPAATATPWVTVVAAVVALAVLVLAGLLPHASTGDTVPSATRRTAVGRDLVCDGGVPGARWRAGTTVPGGRAPGRDLLANGAPVQGTRSAPLGRSVTVRAAPAAAAGAWAVQWSQTGATFAATPCPAPRADWWFPGAGAATQHHGTLTLSNPRDGDAIVDVTVFGPRGPVAAPGLRGLRVASGRTLQLDLAKVSAAYGDLAVHVDASRGLVTATLPELWAPSVVASPVHDWVTDQPGAVRHATLLGVGGQGSAATLLVANPGSRQAVVAIRLLTQGGMVAPKDHATVSVPPGQVVSVPFHDAVDARALGVELTSQVPVTATVRSVQGRDEAYAAAVEPFGSAGVVGVPEGAGGQVVLTGSRAARVTVTAYGADGRQLGSRQVAVPAHGAAAAPVPSAAAAVRLSAPASAAVRGAVLLSAASGLAVEAVPAAASDALVPDVVPLTP